MTDLPPSPWSPAMEGFLVLLAAGAAGDAGAGILEALEEPLSDDADGPVSCEERASSPRRRRDQPPQKP